MSQVPMYLSSSITNILQFIFMKHVFNLFKVKLLFYAILKHFGHYCTENKINKINKIKLLFWFDLRM